MDIGSARRWLQLPLRPTMTNELVVAMNDRRQLVRLTTGREMAELSVGCSPFILISSRVKSQVDSAFGRWSVVSGHFWPLLS